MAALLLRPPATNLVMAINRLAAKALYMEFLDAVFDFIAGMITKKRHK
jgi:hypothetical protein